MNCGEAARRDFRIRCGRRRAHLPGWRTRNDIQIVAVHDPVPERRHLALRLIRNVRVYEDLELMLAGERLDFLDICSPPALHVGAARAALEAGAHAIVEKPLCLDLAEFDALTSMASARSRVLMCVHNWKHSAAYRLAHELVSSARFGPLRYLALERSRTQPAGASGDGAAMASGSKWRLDSALGGGILVDHGWHVFYLMLWLMGDSPVALSAHLGSSPAMPVEDRADLRVVFPRDRIAYCHLSWRAPARRTSAILYGDDAVLELGEKGGRLTYRSGATEDLPVSDPPDDSYHAAWFAGVAADFETAVSQGRGRLAATNLAEARTTLALILAAKRSDRAQGMAIQIANDAT